MKRKQLLFLLALLMTAATGAWAQSAKHVITATYDEQTRSLEQPLPYVTTVGALYEAVTGKSFSDLISGIFASEFPLTKISSDNTDVVSIGELNGADTPVTVNADGPATVRLNFSGYVQGIFVSVVPPLYVTMADGTKDADKWTATVGTNSNAQALPVGELSKGNAVTLTYGGRLKVKSVTATTDAAPAKALIVKPEVGQIIGSDGINYAANATLPDGVTAVAKIVYVGSDNGETAPYNHGLALALVDVSDTKNWCSQSDATCLGTQYDNDTKFNDLSGIANTDALVNNTGHTHDAASAARGYNSGTHPAGTSAWFLPSAGQWDKMITAAGDYATLQTNAGLHEDAYYWSSTEFSRINAWRLKSKNGIWFGAGKQNATLVRACLAF